MIGVCLRLLRHDRLSVVVLEALATCRYVMYCNEVPFVEYTEDLSVAHQVQRRLLDEKEPDVAGPR